MPADTQAPRGPEGDWFCVRLDEVTAVQVRHEAAVAGLTPEGLIAIAVSRGLLRDADRLLDLLDEGGRRHCA